MSRQKLWEKRGECTTFEEYVYEQTGRSVDMLSRTSDYKYSCPGITKAADMLKTAVLQDRPIHVIVDYDADGLDSGAEIFMILIALHAKKIEIIVPKRMKDGYGMNVGMLQNIPDGAFIMTIDNGITAVEPIKEAKRRGMTVLVLDHHQQNGPVPPADLIIDPEAFPDGWTFTGYCGAGLTFKLAECLFPENGLLLDQMSCFAAIATIGDSVDVTGDNRNIIKRGLANINARRCLPGLAAILQLLSEAEKIEHFGTYELAYKLAPMFNAPGRLSDDGGIFVLNALFQTDKAPEFARKLYEINNLRKEKINEAAETMTPMGEKIAFLYDSSLPEGLCGIVAGRLANDLHRPAFVMTDALNGSVKGSARCEADQDVFALMQLAGDLFLQFGGHQCAAGFSLSKENLDPLFKRLEMFALPPAQSDTLYYDLEIKDSDLLNQYVQMNRIGVFGTGLETPVIKVVTSITDVKEIGSDQQHLRFKANGISCIGFSLADVYKELGTPEDVVLYGTLATNWWRGKGSLQFQVADIEAQKK